MKNKDKNNLFFHLDYDCWDVDKTSTSLTKIEVSLILGEGGRLCKNGKIVDRFGIFKGMWKRSDEKTEMTLNAKVADPRKAYEPIVKNYLSAHEDFVKSIDNGKNIADELRSLAVETLGRKIPWNEKISFVQKIDPRKRDVIVVNINFIDSCLHHGHSIQYSTEDQIIASMSLHDNMSKHLLDAAVSNMKKIVFVDPDKINLFDIFDAKGKTNINSKKVQQSFHRLATLVNEIALKEANKNHHLMKSKMIGDVCKIDFMDKISVFCILKACSVYDVSYELMIKNSYPAINEKIETIKL